MNPKTNEQDKENKQRLSNKQQIIQSDSASNLTLRRNKTAESVYRQSIVHSRTSNAGSIMTQPLDQPLKDKSKHSDLEEEKLNIS